MIKREFPWWGELDGWWRTNPAYNSTWSAADSGQDFARCAVELFKLWPNPPSRDSVDPAAGLLNSPQLEDGEIEEGGDFHINDNFFADNSELMNVDSDPPLSHIEMPLFPIPSPSPLLSEQELLLPVVPSSSPSSPGWQSTSANPLRPPHFSNQLLLSSLPANSERANSISLNNNLPPFVSHHPKLQPACPSLKQDHPLLKHQSASTPNTDNSSDSDITSSNLFSALHLSSSSPPSVATFSNDSNSKLSSRPSCKHAWDTPADKLSSNLVSAALTFIKQFQQPQQDRSEVKRHQLKYGYWRTRQKTTTLLANHEHQLTMQCELFAHEETMVARELEKMKLAVKLEELRVQNLTLQKGIAGGEDQGPSSGTQDVYPL
ncbi:hypothetical protein BKA82DRAFT_23403 [Pisolithus tinctorius]|uniref:Uncharacterized protein n=1 Tax=Pisolithus tinctorius Marx 270 TaxID=870435 RepID=A0A0C3KEW3_PISTI|nr:hypothetical protein BKA82DRAFT_23403 [Pisolithus tinctorius]KIO08132.1 hypothetical protein M404DRAFT_23403 [Pisolithus tinctorius Marx 270]